MSLFFFFAKIQQINQTLTASVTPSGSEINQANKIHNPNITPHGTISQNVLPPIVESGVWVEAWNEVWV